MLRKEDLVIKEVLNFKFVLVGEGILMFFLEKKIVIFVEFIKEGSEIKVFVSIVKDLVGKDGKREVFVFLILGTVLLLLLFVCKSI